MSKKKPAPFHDYAGLLRRVKARIRHSQVRAMLSVNAELIQLYWDVGRMLDQKQLQEGYGTSVIPRLAKDLRNELPEVKGFSERNIGLMIAFYRAYLRPAELLQQPVAKVIGREVLQQPVAKVTDREVLPQAVAKVPVPKKVQQAVAPLGPGADSLLWSIPWGHHAVLLAKVKDPGHRLWYMRQTLAHGWSRNVLGPCVQGVSFNHIKPISSATTVLQKSKRA